MSWFTYFAFHLQDQTNCVAFSGLKTSGNDFDNKIIFDQAKVNIGSAFNPNIGRFTAPHTAVYYFTISGISGASKGYTSVTVYKNGEILLSINDGNNESSHNSMGYSWFESMNSGDTLELFVTSNNMYADAENVFTFNGFSVVSRLILSSYQRYQSTFFRSTRSTLTIPIVEALELPFPESEIGEESCQALLLLSIRLRSIPEEF